VRGPTTLRGRLALSALVVATAWVVLLTGAFNLLLVRRLNAQAEEVLRSRAAAAASTVSARSDGTVVLVDAGGDGAVDSGIWIFAGGTAIERAPGSASLQQLAQRLAGTHDQVLRRDEPQAVELYSLGVRYGNRQVATVVAVISLEAYQRSTRNTLVASVLLGLLLLGFVYVLTRRVIQRALAPVAEMTRQAGAWSNEGTAHRFGEDDRPGELSELAETLDDLLDRLSAVLRREQDLSAEISHELRTPLAGIVAETELFVTRQRSPEDAVRAMGSVATSARRMERILETLLTAARAESSPSRGSSDVRTVVNEVVDALGTTRVPLSVEGEAVVAGVEAAVLERVLGPLLDNAVRYAHTGVHVRMSQKPASVCVDVVDDGRGVSEPGRIFEPGYRDAVDDGHQGAGLGLPLARRLARAAGGEVQCRATGAGGHFVVTLPHG
jgi:signal transduction histidine kinase